MIFLKIIPVIGKETGSPELLRTDLIRRVVPFRPAGIGFDCVNLIIEGRAAPITCTGTVDDFVATFNGPAESGRTVFSEPDTPTPDTEFDPDFDLE